MASDQSSSNEPPITWPVDIFSTLSLIGADVLFQFKNGIILFHGSVLRRTSNRMKETLKIDGDGEIKSSHTFDFQSCSRTDGLILHELLYKGERLDIINPRKSKTTSVQRMNHLRRVYNMLRILGIECLKPTIEYWITQETGKPFTMTDIDEPQESVNVSPPQPESTQNQENASEEMQNVTQDDNESNNSEPSNDTSSPVAERMEKCSLNPIVDSPDPSTLESATKQPERSVVNVKAEPIDDYEEEFLTMVNPANNVS